MQAITLAGHAPAAIDLNQPGSYLNWNFFTISVANLVLIAVMVAIFGAALLLPFPRARGGEGPPTAVEPEPAPGADAAPGDELVWTARLRRRALTSLPPAAARSTPTCSPSASSTAPTSPSRCCSSRTATTTTTWRPPST